MGLRLSDLGTRKLNWYDLIVFVYGLNARNSCLYCELNPKTASYENGTASAAILADIYDNISEFMYAFGCANTKKGHSKPKRAKPYPRPWEEDKSVKKIGKDPIPISDFDDWYYGR